MAVSVMSRRSSVIDLVMPADNRENAVTEARLRYDSPQIRQLANLRKTPQAWRRKLWRDPGVADILNLSIGVLVFLLTVRVVAAQSPPPDSPSPPTPSPPPPSPPPSPPPPSPPPPTPTLVLLSKFEEQHKLTSENPLRFRVDFTFPVAKAWFTKEDINVSDTAPDGTPQQQSVTISDVIPKDAGIYPGYHSRYEFSITPPDGREGTLVVKINDNASTDRDGRNSRPSPEPVTVNYDYTHPVIQINRTSEQQPPGNITHHSTANISFSVDRCNEWLPSLPDCRFDAQLTHGATEKVADSNYSDRAFKPLLPLSLGSEDEEEKLTLMEGNRTVSLTNLYRFGWYCLFLQATDQAGNKGLSVNAKRCWKVVPQIRVTGAHVKVAPMGDESDFAMIYTFVLRDPTWGDPNWKPRDRYPWDERGKDGAWSPAWVADIGTKRCMMATLGQEVKCGASDLGLIGEAGQCTLEDRMNISSVGVSGLEWNISFAEGLDNSSTISFSPGVGSGRESFATVSVDARNPDNLPRTACGSSSPHRATLVVKSNDDLNPVIRISVLVYVFEPGKLQLSSVAFFGEALLGNASDVTNPGLGRDACVFTTCREIRMSSTGAEKDDPTERKYSSLRFNVTNVGDLALNWTLTQAPLPTNYWLNPEGVEDETGMLDPGMDVSVTWNISSNLGPTDTYNAAVTMLEGSTSYLPDNLTLGLVVQAELDQLLVPTPRSFTGVSMRIGDKELSRRLTVYNFGGSLKFDVIDPSYNPQKPMWKHWLHIERFKGQNSKSISFGKSHEIELIFRFASNHTWKLGTYNTTLHMNNTLFPEKVVYIDVQVDLHAGKPHAPRTMIRGLGACHAIVGERATVNITLKDEQGNPTVDEDGTDKLEVVLEKKESDDNVCDTKKGRFGMPVQAQIEKTCHGCVKGANDTIVGVDPWIEAKYTVPEVGGRYCLKFYLDRDDEQYSLGNRSFELTSTCKYGFFARNKTSRTCEKCKNGMDCSKPKYGLERELQWPQTLANMKDVCDNDTLAESIRRMYGYDGRLDNIRTNMGYWRRTNTSTLIKRCGQSRDNPIRQKEDVCKGNGKAGDEGCRQGHTGAMCAMCKGGSSEVKYYLDRASGECKECEKNGSFTAVFVVFILMSITSLFLLTESMMVETSPPPLTIKVMDPYGIWNQSDKIWQRRESMTDIEPQAIFSFRVNVSPKNLRDLRNAIPTRTLLMEDKHHVTAILEALDTAAEKDEESSIFDCTTELKDWRHERIDVVLRAVADRWYRLHSPETNDRGKVYIESRKLPFEEPAKSHTITEGTTAIELIAEHSLDKFGSEWQLFIRVHTRGDDEYSIERKIDREDSIVPGQGPYLLILYDDELIRDTLRPSGTEYIYDADGSERNHFKFCLPNSENLRSDHAAVQCALNRLKDQLCDAVVGDDIKPTITDFGLKYIRLDWKATPPGLEEEQHQTYIRNVDLCKMPEGKSLPLQVLTRSEQRATGTQSRANKDQATVPYMFGTNATIDVLRGQTQEFSMWVGSRRDWEDFDFATFAIIFYNFAQITSLALNIMVDYPEKMTTTFKLWESIGYISFLDVDLHLVALECIFSKYTYFDILKVNLSLPFLIAPVTAVIIGLFRGLLGKVILPWLNLRLISSHDFEKGDEEVMSKTRCSSWHGTAKRRLHELTCHLMLRYDGQGTWDLILEGMATSLLVLEFIVVYPQVIKVFVRVLLCVDVDHDGIQPPIQHLKVDLRISCQDGEYQFWKSVSLAVLSIYGCVIPLLFSTILYHGLPFLHFRVHGIREAVVKHDPRTRRRFGFLFTKYSFVDESYDEDMKTIGTQARDMRQHSKSKIGVHVGDYFPDSRLNKCYDYLSRIAKYKYAWESVILLKKLFFVFTLVYLNGRTFEQVSAALVIGQVFLCLHVWFQPFKNRFLNVFETVTQVVTCMTLQGSILFYTSNQSEGWKYNKLVRPIARDVLFTANAAVGFIFLTFVCFKLGLFTLSKHVSNEARIRWHRFIEPHSYAKYDGNGHDGILPSRHHHDDEHVPPDGDLASSSPSSFRSTIAASAVTDGVSVEMTDISLRERYGTPRRENQGMSREMVAE